MAGLAVASVLAVASPAWAATPSGATGSRASLPSGPGPRPGPAILYAPPATAPQLTNTGIWRAPPLLVSGASAYRDGEFVSQDFLYDDHGAAEAADPSDPRSSGNTFSRPDGTYTYPTNPAYANDAADLLETRVKPTASATAFRVTMNTMTSPALLAFSIAIGGTEGQSHPFPDGANVRAPAAMFLTVHPSGSTMVADLVDASSGAPVPGPAPAVSVDTTRHQIQVLVPHSA
ncbi:MAG: glucodextranase DOMON-like domain-containing protein, partial [Acidimicrobiales bacterium]